MSTEEGKENNREVEREIQKMKGKRRRIKKEGRRYGR